MGFLVRFIFILVDLYQLGLLIYIILSWIPAPELLAVRRWLAPLFEPPLSRIRALVKPISVGTGFLDLSPLLLFVGILVLKRILALLLVR